MAVTETRNLPAQFIEDLGKDYATQLTAATAQPLPTQQFAPTVAGQTALQQEATKRTQAGLGTFQPFLTAAQQAGATAGTGLGLAQTGLGVAGQELTGAGQAWYSRNNYCRSTTICRCSRNRINSSWYNIRWSISIY